MISLVLAWRQPQEWPERTSTVLSMMPIALNVSTDTVGCNYLSLFFYTFWYDSPHFILVKSDYWVPSEAAVICHWHRLRCDVNRMAQCGKYWVWVIRFVMTLIGWEVGRPFHVHRSHVLFVPVKTQKQIGGWILYITAMIAFFSCEI